MPDFAPLHQPGNPILPSRVYNVLLPPDVDWKSIRLNVVERDSQVLPGTYDVDPAGPDVAIPQGQRIESWGSAKRIVNGRNADVYERNAFYPDRHLRLLPYSQMRKWKFVRVEFRPARYNPVTRQLRVLTSATVEIQFERLPQKSAELSLSDHVMDDQAPDLFVNFSAARDWYPPALKAAKAGTGYAIITSSNIVNNCANLQAFIWQKQVQGFTVYLATEADFMPLTGQAPNNRAEKIRQWLINHYIAYSLQYVLLIGDPMPIEWGSEGDIPMKLCWPRFIDSEWRDVATDEFYADLTGNWDIDADGYYGTWNDYIYGTGDGDFQFVGVDLYAEVWVGRIPVYNNRYDITDRILQKIINYQNQDDRLWRTNILLPMSFLDTEPKVDSAEWAEQMIDDFLASRGYQTWRQYQQGSFTNLCDSIYPSEEELRGDYVVRNQWMSNQWGIVCWAAHGFAQASVVGIDNNIYDGRLFESTYVESLNDMYPSFTCQMTCLNGEPKWADNLQYSILTKGGIAAVGNTQLSWGFGAYGEFDQGSDAAGILYQYMLRLTLPHKAGDALYLGKEYVILRIGEDRNMLANHFGMNLYGDPSISLDAAPPNYYPLPNKTWMPFMVSPKNYSIPVSGSEWYAAGLKNSVGNDLKAYDLSGCFVTSAAPVQLPELVAVNGRQWGPTTHTLRLSGGINHSNYVIEAEYSDIPKIATGISYGGELDGPEYFDLFEANLIANNMYSISAEVTDGNSDFALIAFSPKRWAGTITDYDWYADSAHDESPEVLPFTAPVSGTYAFAVLKRDNQKASYIIYLDEYPPVSAPANVSATDGMTNYIEITWDAVPGATYYRLYRGEIPDDPASAQPINVWQWGGTSFIDTDVMSAKYHYYWVKSATSSSGLNASDFSASDSGFCQPEELFHDYAFTMSGTELDYFKVNSNIWYVVGLRSEGYDHRFIQLCDWDWVVRANSDRRPTSLCVVDGRHVSPQNVYVKGSCDANAQMEYEGMGDVLTSGNNGPYMWPAGDVAQIYDIHLTPGRCEFTIQYAESSKQNLHMALFDSHTDRPFQSLSDELPWDFYAMSPEWIVLGCTVSNEDDYGLCVWADDSNPAEFSIRVERPEDGEWLGTVSSDWNNPGNWKNSILPTTNTDVIIPSGTPYSPIINISTAACRGLSIDSGASLLLMTNNLWIRSSLTLKGHLDIPSNNELRILGDLFWDKQGSITMANFAQIYLRRNAIIRRRAIDPQIQSGMLIFDGTNDSLIAILATNWCVQEFMCAKSGSGAVELSGDCTGSLAVSNLWIAGTGCQFRSYSHYPIRISGNLQSEGHFNAYNGEVEFVGNPWVPLLLQPNDFFHDLTINSQYPLILSAAYSDQLNVNGNLTIRHSTLNNSSNLTIRVGGDWSNAVGSAGFVRGTSTVAFVASDTNATQRIFGNTRFHNILEDCVGTGGLQVVHDTVVNGRFTGLRYSQILSNLFVAGVLDLDSTQCVFNVCTGGVVSAANVDLGGHLLVAGGTLTAQDLVDPCIVGRLSVLDGNVSLNQRTGPGETIDLSGDLTICGGTVEIRDDDGFESTWPGCTNLSLSMSGGLLDFPTRGIRIVYGADFTENISGGTIRTPGNFVCERTDFHPTGGTLEMVGASPAYISVTPTGKCHSLKINKSGSSVVASNSLTLGGDFLLESGTFTAPPQLSVGGNWSNGVGPAAFVEGTGVVQFIGSGLILNSEDFSDVRVCSGGHIYVQTNCEIHVQRNLLITNGLMRLLSFSTLDVDGDIALRSRQSSGLNAGSEGTCIFVGGNWRDDSYQHTTLIGFYPSTNCPVSFIGTTNGTLTGDSPYFHHLILDRAGGSVRANNNITLSGNFIISNGTWSSSSTGLTCSLSGDLRIESGGWWGVTSNNTLKLSGDRDQSIANRAGGGPFSTISDQKNSGTVTLLTPISTMNRGGLSVRGGTFDINSNSCLLAGSAELLNEGTLSLGPAGRLGLGSNGMLIVESGGQLLVAGESGSPATINRTTNGYFEISVESGGYISAENAVFDYLGLGGIQVQNNAVVEPEHAFTDCMFRNGQPRGRLLDIENNQDLRIQGANFPTDAGGGANNVRKNKAKGHLYLTDATGVFSGPAYESDPNNLIDWDQGLLSGLSLFIPCVATAGGKYDFTVIASPDYATLPITYRWQITGMDPLQHSGNTTDAVLAVTWDGTGQKTVWVLASNVWNSLSVGRTVDVQKLDVSEVLLNSAGNALVFRIAGTSSNSYYNVQVSTNLCSGSWETVAPGGVNLRGNDGTMSRTIILTNQNPSALRGFYRAVVNEPDRPISRK